MDNIFVRIIVAVISCAILFAVVGALLALLAVPNAKPLAYIIDLCIAGAASFYIIKGKLL